MSDRVQRAVKAKLATGLVRLCPDLYCKTVAFTIVDVCPECGAAGVACELGVTIREPRLRDLDVRA